MCGVALAFTQSRIEELVQRLKHRGPDDSTIVKQRINSRDCYLGHTRLAIVDTATAAQPLVRSQHLTAFNGEIFNYKDLPGTTEVEVVAHVLRTGTAYSMSGYFAAIQLDVGKSRVLLARDPYGVMPLYFCKTTKEVASEPDLLSRPVPVPPGSIGVLDLRKKSLKFHRFYYPVSRTSEFSVATATDLLVKAVSRTVLHTEVGSSIALSGGLDSRLLAYCAKEVGVSPTCITAAINEQNSEIALAKRTAETLGFDHKVVLAPSFDFSNWAVHYRKTRAANHNWHNIIKLRAFLRQYAVAGTASTKVLLCGEGADEIDCGYPSHAKALDLVKKRLSVLNSQPSMTLDRVNQAGMAFSKEYRVPYLDLDFSSYMLSVTPKPGKVHLRSIAKHLGMKNTDVSKYSEEDKEFTKFAQHLHGVSNAHDSSLQYRSCGDS